MNLQIETQYNLLVQVDYLMGLFTAVLLGRATENGNWFLFVLFLLVSLVIGILTVKAYCRMIRKIVKLRE
jgi:ABC-type multidrug transport system permease subunit